MGAELRNQPENEENKAAKIAKRSRNSYMRQVHKALEESWGNNRNVLYLISVIKMSNKQNNNQLRLKKLEEELKSIYQEYQLLLENHNQLQ